MTTEQTMSPSGEDRRSVLKAGMAMAGAAAVAGSARAAPLSASQIGKSPLAQPELPWGESAMAPVISAETIGFHYGKHHAGYFANLKKLVADTPMADQSLEEIVIAAHRDGKQGLFNNAAQAWNHNFYWQSLSPTAKAPSGVLKAAIERDFGSQEKLNEELAKVTTGQFGSGWGWLVSDAGKLKVMSTAMADLPFTQGLKPLLTLDVWEHAYYLDYQNRRADQINALVKDHLDWDFAGRNYAA